MPNTHGAVEIGNNGHPPQDEAVPGFDQLSEQDRADLAALAEATGTAPKPIGEPVEAMFLVIIPRHGHAFGIGDVNEAAKFYGRPATIEEMAYATRVVAEEIAMNKQAQIITMRNMQTAQALAAQQENARVAAQLAGHGGMPGAPGSAAFRKHR